MRARWPEPQREMALRLVAMLAIGALCLVRDAWSRDGGKRPIVEFLHAAFEALEAEV